MASKYAPPLRTFSPTVKVPTINTNIPSVPQYSPMGSADIPGTTAKLTGLTSLNTKQPKSPTLTSNASRVALPKIAAAPTTYKMKNLLSPINVGFSAMNVAGGTGSVGGEVAGQIGYGLSQKYLGRLIDKLPGVGKPARFLKGTAKFISGLTAYGAGNHVGGKIAPIYKREQKPILVPYDFNKAASMEESLINNVGVTYMNKYASMYKEALVGALKGIYNVGKGFVNAGIQGGKNFSAHKIKMNPNLSSTKKITNNITGARLGMRNHYKSLTPEVQKNVDRAVKGMKYGGAVGGGMYLGNKIFNSTPRPMDVPRGIYY